jgi:hypothetical protein
MCNVRPDPAGPKVRSGTRLQPAKISYLSKVIIALDFRALDIFDRNWVPASAGTTRFWECLKRGCDLNRSTQR